MCVERRFAQLRWSTRALYKVVEGEANEKKGSDSDEVKKRLPQREQGHERHQDTSVRCFGRKSRQQ